MPEVRPIDANGLKRDLAECCNLNDPIFEIINNQPTIEPEVRRGHWIELPKAFDKDENPCKCSACGHVLSFYNHYPKSKFCPNCGARMDGGADDAGRK